MENIIECKNCNAVYSETRVNEYNNNMEGHEDFILCPVCNCPLNDEEVITDKDVEDFFNEVHIVDHTMYKIDMDIIKSTIDNVLTFEKDHGREATKAAIWWGAFENRVTMHFIHPSDSIKEITPDWILYAFQKTVS